MNSLSVVGNPSSQMDYTTSWAGFSSHTLEVFFVSAFFTMEITRMSTSSRAEMMRANVSYKFLTAASSICAHPCQHMCGAAAPEQEVSR